MHTILRNTFKSVAMLLLVMALLGSSLGQLAGRAAALPATPCTGTGTVTCDLWARTGTATLYGAVSVPIWGFAAAAADPAGLPGPALVVNEGDTVTVNLTNVDIAENVSLLFQGQAMIPDTTGVGAGGSTSYTFTASNPGTYLYEAGQTSNGQHQVAMGLYGALVVLPATVGQAYDTAATTYNEEALLVLSEYDTALAADPAGFDMRNYRPSYFLINGKAYPDTDAIPVTAGNLVLLRYVNAGLQSHAMSLVGLSQTLIATDGGPFNIPHQVVSETVAPGQTLDAIVTVPALAVPGTKYAVYDSNLSLRNSNVAGMGGMLALLTVDGVPAGGDTAGPISSVTLAPTQVDNSTLSVDITASADDTANGGSNVDAAEYFVDVTAADGTGTALSGTYGSLAASPLSDSISGATLTSLATGTHTVYVHALDSAGNWGAFSSAVFSVDKTGPTSSAISLTPNPTNGTADVTLYATGNDSATGNHNITAAEYTIDGGTAVGMSINQAAPVASLSATISAATVAGLSDGPHTIEVRSQDSVGNWGATASTSLLVDTAGPSVSALGATPNPTNGSTGVNTSVPAVRVSATFTDGLTNVVAAEGFLDTSGTLGSGFVFNASDGVFNSTVESAYSDIPMPVINALSTGDHTIYVHGKDAAGNWAAMSSFILTVDKTGPAVSGQTLTPASVTNAPVTVSATADDSAVGNSNIAGGEFFIDAVGAGGTGTAMSASTTGPVSGITGTIPTATVNALSVGSHTVYIHAQDALGNWGAMVSATLTTTALMPDKIFSDGFEAKNTGAWSTRTGIVNVAPAARLDGIRSLRVRGNRANWLQYNFGTAANPATGTLDARFYFLPNGNYSSGKDIFTASSTSSFSNTLFRVRYRLRGGIPQVQIRAGSAFNGTWTNLAGGIKINVIEVVWQAAGSDGPNPGTLRLYVNGVLAQTLTVTSSDQVGAFRLGSVAGNGTTTFMYFDAFSAKRSVSPFFGK